MNEIPLIGGGRPRRSSKRYRLGKVIGEGGTSTVVAAFDIELGRFVAIKKLKPSASEDTRKRFLKEARLSGRLFHPGMIPVYDAGVLDEGEPFYAMERISGETLKDLLRARTLEEIGDRRNVLRFVDIFERVCQTIAHAHSESVIHRDLKPGNILVDRFGAVYIMDWGLAKRIPTEEDPFISHQTEVDVVMGTPGYMSPEQARSLAATRHCQTDVFALGAVLYEILTGRRAFPDAKPGAPPDPDSYTPPDPPISVNPGCGRVLSAICMKALEIEKSLRYPTAGELAGDIRNFREYRPTSAIRPRAADHLQDWLRRNRMRASFLAILLLTAVAVATVFGVRAYDERRVTAATFEAIRTTGEEIAELQGRQGETAIKCVEMMRLLETVARSSDPQLLELARLETLETIKTLMRGGEVVIARAYLRSALAESDGGNRLGFSPQEIRRLQALLEKADSTAQQQR